MRKGVQSLFILSGIQHIICDFYFLFIYGDASPVILFWILSSCFGVLAKANHSLQEGELGTSARKKKVL